MLNLLPKEFRKLTPEERFNKRIDDVFLTLTKTEDKPFTELETVQICNSVRRKLFEFLDERKSTHMEQSLHHNQRANEIAKALEFLE